MKGKVFIAQEVQAIIVGNKTQFREVIKPQPWHVVIDADFKKGNNIPKFGHDEKVIKCPYQVGQKIFCKESFAEVEVGAVDDYDVKWKPAQHMKQEYSRLTLQITGIRVERLADISEEDAISEGIHKLYSEEEFKLISEERPNSTNPWKNYLWYGLIGREITRKQSESWENQYSNAESAKDSFATLWNTTHKKPEEKFEASPWVWVIDFEVVK